MLNWLENQLVYDKINNSEEMAKSLELVKNYIKNYFIIIL